MDICNDNAIRTKVETTWSRAERAAFKQAFEQIIFRRHALLPFRIGDKYRWPRALLLYQVGDYRRAALKVAETQATARVRSILE